MLMRLNKKCGWWMVNEVAKSCKVPKWNNADGDGDNPYRTPRPTMTRKGITKHNNNPIPRRAIVQCAFLQSLQMQMSFEP